ncbi:neuropeptide Y receptor type 1-like [Dendronephthya gigantea]|uniref:neuropeptide Y receptor type 1-like n=1 Tax=Dendronephthya gigantea TaxID=151771 RepID=UPI00106BB8BE|nr:neuropeptide Y receptor type 1-like [Dendronephthya gigantea]
MIRVSVDGNGNKIQGFVIQGRLGINKPAIGSFINVKNPNEANEANVRYLDCSLAETIIFISGNVIVLVVVKKQTTRNIIDILIAHLSIFDITLIVFTTPPLFLQHINNSIQLGKIFQKIFECVTTFCAVISVYTVVAIAIESVFFAYNVLPFVTVFHLYSRIIMKLRSRGKEVRLSHATRSQQSNFTINNHRKTMVMLITVLVAILVCHWPYTIFHIIMAFNEVRTMSTTLELLNSSLRLLSFLPPIINPILYNFFSDKFRAGFRQVLLSNL